MVKADWDKLKNKKMVAEVLKAEAIMHAGWNMATQAQLPLEQIALPFGKLQMRLALHLLQKKRKGDGAVQGHGRDQREICK